MAEIRIGTASWTDPGFIEDWYPKRLPTSQWLSWYAEHFDLVEVNATFYSLQLGNLSRLHAHAIGTTNTSL
jgi:uncharacterized protein YecE (DUF72 family)